MLEIYQVNGIWNQEVHKSDFCQHISHLGDKSSWGQPEEETHANFLQVMLVFKQSILYKVALTQKKCLQT